MKIILVVDDEEALLEILSDVLRDEGYGVITAANGRDGLARAAGERPELVITDCMMPIAGGHSLILGLRALPATSAIPILLMSGSDRDLAYPERWREDPTIAFLQKPFALDELLSAIETLIGKGETTLH